MRRVTSSVIRRRIWWVPFFLHCRCSRCLGFHLLLMYCTFVLLKYFTLLLMYVIQRIVSSFHGRRNVFTRNPRARFGLVQNCPWLFLLIPLHLRIINYACEWQMRGFSPVCNLGIGELQRDCPSMGNLYFRGCPEKSLIRLMLDVYIYLHDLIFNEFSYTLTTFWSPA